MRTKFILPLFIFLGFACNKKDVAPQPEDEVWLLYKRFNPTSLDVKKGATVTFINKDNANHTVTETSNRFASGKIKSGNQFQFTFSDSGQYTIYCNYHPDNLQEQLYITVK